MLDALSLILDHIQEVVMVLWGLLTGTIVEMHLEVVVQV